MSSSPRRTAASAVHRESIERYFKRWEAIRLFPSSPDDSVSRAAFRDSSTPAAGFRRNRTQEANAAAVDRTRPSLRGPAAQTMAGAATEGEATAAVAATAADIEPALS